MPMTVQRESTASCADATRRTQGLLRPGKALLTQGLNRGDGAAGHRGGAVRTFAPHTRKPASNVPVANERLVAMLMRAKGARSAANIPVRVVPNPLSPSAVSTGAPKPVSVVVSLTEAIQLAIDAEMDLIEISLEQEVPVVTVGKVNAIVYHGNKSSKKSVPAASLLKEVTMQAGIAANDLQRKVDTILKFLDKGHPCVVTVRAGRKFTWNNPDAAMHALERILALLQDRVEMVKQPAVNEQKNTGQFQVRAKKK